MLGMKVVAVKRAARVVTPSDEVDCIRIAVDACMRRERGLGQGFKNQTSRRERPVGTDAQTRALKEV